MKVECRRREEGAGGARVRQVKSYHHLQLEKMQSETVALGSVMQCAPAAAGV